MKKLITILLLLLMLSGCGSSFTPKATDQLTVILHAGGGYDGLTYMNAQETFDRYFFSHYKVYYTAGQMLEYFSDDRIWGFALPTYTDGDIRSHLSEVKQTKQVFVFTPATLEEVEDAAALGADGVYLDFPELIE